MTWPALAAPSAPATELTKACNGVHLQNPSLCDVVALRFREHWQQNMGKSLGVTSRPQLAMVSVVRAMALLKFEDTVSPHTLFAQMLVLWWVSEQGS